MTHEPPDHAGRFGRSALLDRLDERLPPDRCAAVGLAARHALLVYGSGMLDIVRPQLAHVRDAATTLATLSPTQARALCREVGDRLALVLAAFDPSPDEPDDR